MTCVLGEAGYAALKVRHQLYHCIEADSMAAIHGDDIFAEGEPEKLNRLDGVLKRLVDVKVLDRTGQGAMEQCQYLKKHARHGITSACCVFRRRRHAERSGAQRLQRHVLGLADRAQSCE